MMYNIIGTGKTGQFVQQYLSPEKIAGMYDSKNPPTCENLKKGTISIVFVDGAVMGSLIPLLQEAGQHVVTGSTAVEWPEGLDETLKENALSWIHGANFSLLMNVFFYMTKKLHPLESFLKTPEARIYEEHHVSKKDQPSGTALTLQSLLGWDHTDVLSERVADATGEHSLLLKTPEESLEIRHETTTRQVYAQGAVWAAERFLTACPTPGFLKFETLIERAINDLNAG